MGQSLVKNYIHLVYSTKNREPRIAKPYREDLYKYLSGIFENWDSPLLIAGGVDDHVHQLFVLSKNYALKKIVEEVKKGSSKWMKAEGPRDPEFEWQGGYAAFSVSPSNVDQVSHYIETQEEHHRTRSFKDELRTLLERHGIPYDERYLWT